LYGFKKTSTKKIAQVQQNQYLKIKKQIEAGLVLVRHYKASTPLREVTFVGQACQLLPGHLN
jgi:hypothetical protein